MVRPNNLRAWRVIVTVTFVHQFIFNFTKMRFTEPKHTLRLGFFVHLARTRVHWLEDVLNER
jgi:hypothetical protein